MNRFGQKLALDPPILISNYAPTKFYFHEVMFLKTKKKKNAHQAIYTRFGTQIPCSRYKIFPILLFKDLTNSLKLWDL